MAEQSSGPRPEKELPVVRGAKLAVWANANGRSVTVSPPRFKDQQGNWRDGSFFVADIPMLIFVLQQALTFCYTASVPSQDNDQPPI